MRKLLNTVYITNESMYLGLDGENLVCQLEGKTVFRIPFDNIEGITCFSYLGCSPALMGKCVEKHIALNFVSPQGKFLGKICGETKGNVFMRVAQIDAFRTRGILLAQNSIASKLANSVKVLKRSMHDDEALRSDAEIIKAMDVLKKGTESVLLADNIESIMGIEGNCASAYFSVFGKMLKGHFGISFCGRNKRPPLDPVNAVLSFVYSLWTRDYAAALETVGLDSYIGFCHSLRSGRPSLACDLVEETRCIVERFVITLFNLKMLNQKDFDVQLSGACMLNVEGRKKVIEQWQNKKRSDILHPYLKQKIALGLLPYVQSNLLAKMLRGEIDEYPCYLLK